MAERLAASGLPPTAKIQRPHTIRLLKTATTMASRPTTMALTGTKPTLDSPGT